MNKLEITPDKQYLAAAGNPHIRLFEVTTNNPQPVQSFDGHTNNVTAVGFDRDSKWLFSGSEDGTVKLWDVRCERRWCLKLDLKRPALEHDKDRVARIPRCQVLAGGYGISHWRPVSLMGF